MRLSFCQAIAAAVFSAVCGSSASTAATYMQFDVPHAVGGTFPTSINANGDVVGNFVDAGGDTHGFVRKANGIIKTFDAQDGLPTFPTAINDVGTVAGFYHLDRADNASFVRAPNGKIETFKAPGNTAVTVADAIDSKGTITGSYFDFDAYADFAFIRSPQGKFKRFSANKDGSTIPCCLDEAGIIAGTQIIYNGAHGFVREKGGDIAIFDVPGTSGDTLVNARSEPGWIAATIPSRCLAINSSIAGLCGRLTRHLRHSNFRSRETRNPAASTPTGWLQEPTISRANPRADFCAPATAT